MSLDAGTELWMLGVIGFGVVFYLVSLRPLHKGIALIHN